MVGLGGPNPVRGLLGGAPQAPSPMPIGGGGFNNLAAGNKSYGGGRPFPNVGQTANKAGYAKRDGQMAARRNAYMDRMKGLGA